MLQFPHIQVSVHGVCRVGESVLASNGTCPSSLLAAATARLSCVQTRFWHLSRVAGLIGTEALDRRLGLIGSIANSGRILCSALGFGAHCGLRWLISN